MLVYDSIVWPWPWCDKWPSLTCTQLERIARNSNFGPRTRIVNLFNAGLRRLGTGDINNLKLLCFSVDWGLRLLDTPMFEHSNKEGKWYIRQNKDLRLSCARSGVWRGSKWPINLPVSHTIHGIILSGLQIGFTYRSCGATRKHRKSDGVVGLLGRGAGNGLIATREWHCERPLGACIPTTETEKQQK